MKKVIAFLLALTALLSMIIVTSCNKEEPKSLAGTTWISQGGEETTTVIFDATTCKIIEQEDGFIINQYIGTYTYADPVVTIIVQGEAIVGTVSGNAMILNEVILIKH